MEFYAKTKRFLFIIFFAAIVVGLIFYVFSGQEITAGQIRSFGESLGIWLPISFIIFYAGLSVFFPTTPLMALAGLLFGFWYGFLYTTVAGFVSAMFVFFLSRHLGRDLVDDFLSARSFKLLDRYHENIAHHGVLTIALLRLTPVMPFPMLNFLMGVSKISAKNYALGTFLGLIPSHVLTVYFGTLVLKFIL